MIKIDIIVFENKYKDEVEKIITLAKLIDYDINYSIQESSLMSGSKIQQITFTRDTYIIHLFLHARQSLLRYITLDTYIQFDNSTSISSWIKKNHEEILQICLTYFLSD